MHKVTYHHKGRDGKQDEGPKETKVGAFSFKSGEPVLIDAEHHQVPYTVANNPWFTVEEVKAKKEKPNA